MTAGDSDALRDARIDRRLRLRRNIASDPNDAAARAADLRRRGVDSAVVFLRHPLVASRRGCCWNDDDHDRGRPVAFRQGCCYGDDNDSDHGRPVASRRDCCYDDDDDRGRPVASRQGCCYGDDDDPGHGRPVASRQDCDDDDPGRGRLVASRRDYDDDDPGRGHLAVCHRDYDDDDDPGRLVVVPAGRLGVDPCDLGDGDAGLFRPATTSQMSLNRCCRYRCCCHLNWMTQRLVVAESLSFSERFSNAREDRPCVRKLRYSNA